jgi:hypothetical protein
VRFLQKLLILFYDIVVVIFESKITSSICAVCPNNEVAFKRNVEFHTVFGAALKLWNSKGITIY